MFSGFSNSTALWLNLPESYSSELTVNQESKMATDKLEVRKTQLLC